MQRNNPCAGEENGMLYIVGIGPGDPRHTTPAATRAIREADTVIAYETYRHFMKEEWLSEGEVITSGPWDVDRRVEQALGAVQEGKDVAVVSSGDAGIYGMAGPLLEEVGDREIAVEVIPGMTALSAAASLVGAPVTVDFAAVSLSDYQTPWEQIEKRLESAGKGDFILALYNPRSKRRQQHLSRALDILKPYRKARTPVALVRNAMRSDEEARVETLESLSPADVDMRTILIVGNSRTRVDERGRMITPREG